MFRLFAIPVLASLFGCVAGCDSGVKWTSGNYEVYWIDVSSDLTLGLKLGDGNAIGRVMPQVFAVGEDDRWMVAGRYPDGDRTKKEFFYFPKALDHAHKNADEIVQGPYSEEEFNQHKARLSLPSFNKYF